MTAGASAVLLAAGLSSRMGVLKPLLDWQGVPLVRYQVTQLAAAGCDPVVVVTGNEAQQVETALNGSGATIVFNAEYTAGRAGSVRCGAGALPIDVGQIVVLNVDQPRSAAVIHRLLMAHAGSDCLLCVPAFENRRGHPLVVSGVLRAELCQVREEDQGIRALVRRHEHSRLTVPFDDAEVLLDLNTPESYRLASTRPVQLGDEPAKAST